MHFVIGLSELNGRRKSLVGYKFPDPSPTGLIIKLPQTRKWKASSYEKIKNDIIKKAREVSAVTLAVWMIWFDSKLAVRELWFDSKLEGALIS